MKAHLKDCLVGIIIALVSIPISMGYASVAGLPVVYGLYGSLLPIFVFALLSTSFRFVFGVDAAPAALTGGMIAAMGIVPESAEALQIIPCITILVSLWLFLFFLLRADRILKFISQPVMGGFITGIGMTIICMQIPKLFGGNAGTGELLSLLLHIKNEAVRDFNLISLLLGLFTIALILLSKHFFPKLPSQPILMFVGAALTFFFHIDQKFGIKTLPSVQAGLPSFLIPNISVLLNFDKRIWLQSASIAVVIFSETLLATSNIALKYEESISPRKEILAYALANFVSALSGSCPVNGSVSRTGIANQFGVSSKLMSISASLAMLLILLCGTGFIAYLPVPVLTGIVISALIGTFEFSLAHRLRALDKSEFFIFYAAFASVLLLGTIYGVIVGVLLAAITFIIRQSKPAVDFLGIVPGLKGYYSLTRKGTAAVPIKNVIIYRFSGPLFYANIKQFCDDAENSVKADTKIFVVDSSGISSVDATAAERLLRLYKKFSAKGIQFYLAGHVGAVNEQLRAFGAMELIEKRVVRARIAFALDAAGLPHPYPADETVVPLEKNYSVEQAEFEWAFGRDAEKVMMDFANKIAKELAVSGTFDMQKIQEQEIQHFKDYWSEVQEDEFLDILEMTLESFDQQKALVNHTEIEQKISLRHAQLESLLLEKNEEVVQKIIHHRLVRDKKLQQKYPTLYARIQIEHERYFEELSMTHPELAKKLAQIISSEEEKI